MSEFSQVSLRRVPQAEFCWKKKKKKLSWYMHVVIYEFKVSQLPGTIMLLYRAPNSIISAQH